VPRITLDPHRIASHPVLNTADDSLHATRITGVIIRDTLEDSQLCALPLGLPWRERLAKRLPRRASVRRLIIALDARSIAHADDDDVVELLAARVLARRVVIELHHVVHCPDLVAVLAFGQRCEECGFELGLSFRQADDLSAIKALMMVFKPHHIDLHCALVKQVDDPLFEAQWRALEELSRRMGVLMMGSQVTSVNELAQVRRAGIAFVSALPSPRQIGADNRSVLAEPNSTGWATSRIVAAVQQGWEFQRTPAEHFSLLRRFGRALVALSVAGVVAMAWRPLRAEPAAAPPASSAAVQP